MTLPEAANADRRNVNNTLLAWMALSVIIAFISVQLGVPARVAAGAAALALAPAVLSLMLSTRPGGGATLAAAGWVASAIAASAVTGGAASPLSALFLIGPAYALRVGGAAQAQEASILAVVGFAFAVIVALLQPEAPPQTAPELWNTLGIGVSGWLLASKPDGVIAAHLAPRKPAAAPPAQPAADAVRAQETPAATPDDAARRIAEVSHELRTPLNHIIGYAESVERQVFGPALDKYVEYAGLISTSGRRLLKLVNDWLDMSRLAAGAYQIQREPFEIRALAFAAIEAARVTPEGKSRKIIFASPDTPLMVQADPGAMRQIFDNLIANALKFAPEGGVVQVRADARARVLVIEVADNGPGVSDADKARIGTPFVRSEAAAGVEGVGLGLSLVRALAAAHEGALTVLDAPGGGALIRVSMRALIDPANDTAI